MVIFIDLMQTNYQILKMNRTTIDKEVYPLLSTFLAEVHAFSSNRKALSEICKLESDIQKGNDNPEEFQNLMFRNASDQTLVLMDMKDLSRAKILEKYYTLLLTLDPDKHGYLIAQLDMLYDCFSSATYDMEVVGDIGRTIREVINEIPRSQ